MRRLLLLTVCLLLAGCGTGNPDQVKVAETEGVYVDAGNLTYQVQLSRYLNPGSIEDRQYLEGLPSADPGAGSIWFGVWMRVKNYSDATQMPTNSFTISDTENDIFTPVALPETNPFAYHPHPLGHANVLPAPDSAASSGPIQGSLILFKLKTTSLPNRPLLL